MAEIDINVALFQEVAGNLDKYVKSMSDHFSQIDKIISKARKEWVGNSSENVQNSGGQLRKSYGDLQQELGAYGSTLRQIAGIFTDAEKTVASQSQTLESL